MYLFGFFSSNLKMMKQFFKVGINLAKSLLICNYLCIVDVKRFAKDGGKMYKDFLVLVLNQELGNF